LAGSGAASGIAVGSLEIKVCLSNLAWLFEIAIWQYFWVY
jgi:hypothetical protein